MRLRFTPFLSVASLTSLCMVSAACATAGANADMPTTLSFTRPDGGAAVCTRPPKPWLSSPAGVGVATSMPDIIQRLIAAAPKAAGGTQEPDASQQKGPPTRGPQAGAAGSGDVLDAVLKTAPTPKGLDVLDYRVCLEYGKGTLSRDAYVHWLLDLRPQAYRSARKGES
jgi:hypothetical protein